MKKEKNELLQFVAGIVMLVVGLFILSQKIIVYSGWFGIGGMMSIGGIRVSSGMIMIPLIAGIVWMFASGASFASKVFTVFSVLLIIVSVILTTNLHLMTITLYEWIVILVLIFGGSGFIAKVLFAGNGKNDNNQRAYRHKGRRSNDQVELNSSIDQELEQIRKNMK